MKILKNAGLKIKEITHYENKNKYKGTLSIFDTDIIYQVHFTVNKIVL